MRIRGPWNESEIESFLHEARIPIRVAVPRADGGLLVVSVWYAFEGRALWCATARESLLARLIREQRRCGFEVAGDQPPYRGVRGHGAVSVVPERGDEMLRRLADRYLGQEYARFTEWLLTRNEVEVAIRIEPTVLTSWDYAARMKVDCG